MRMPLRYLCPRLAAPPTGPTGAEGPTGASDPGLAEPGSNSFRAVGPVLMTESELKEESVLLGESIYWVGPRDGYRSEL